MRRYKNWLKERPPPGAWHWWASHRERAARRLCRLLAPPIAVLPGPPYTHQNPAAAVVPADSRACLPPPLPCPLAGSQQRTARGAPGAAERGRACSGWRDSDCALQVERLYTKLLYSSPPNAPARALHSSLLRKYSARVLFFSCRPWNSTGFTFFSAD
jgi:hypothetical protein